MPEAILGNVAGAVVGGLMGGDDGGQQQTNTKEPWEPARKPLINSINTGQDLERYYQQNPFNRLQQQGYQNLYSDLDQYRNQIAPGLMNFANGMMTSNYQRGPRNSQVEAMQSQQRPAMGQPQMMQQGQDGSYSPQGGGLLGAMNSFGQDPQFQAGLSAFRNGQSTGAVRNLGQSMEFQGDAPQGLLGASQGVFQAPSQGAYGLLDFTQLNPFTATNGIPKAPVVDPAAKTPEQIWREEANQRERDRQTNLGGA